MYPLAMGMESRQKIYARFGVLILPEFAAAQYNPEPGTVMIRINDHFFQKLNHPEKFEDIIELCFADIDQPNSYDLMMTEKQAVRIIDFMEKHWDKKFVIHCQAGISRSSATACGYACLHGSRELDDAIRKADCFYPNSHVYRLLVNEIARRQYGETAQYNEDVE